MLQSIRDQLNRVSAGDVRVSMDEQFEPEAGQLLKVEKGGAYWHMYPETFQQLLEELPDGAGSDAVHEAVESKAHPVWHGPEPEPARE